MKFNMVGQIAGWTGYSCHTRNCAKALLDKGIDLGIQTQNTKGVTGQRLLDATKKLHKGAVTEMIMFPEQWRFKLADRLKLVGYCVFEGDKLPLTWELACNEPEITEIWCPSKHVKDAILNSGVKKDVYVIPHGFDEKIFRPTPVEGVGRDDNRPFRFLYCGGWSRGCNDRKNVCNLVKAFKEEFNKENTELILKINMSYGGVNPVDVIESLDLQDGPPIHLVTEFLTEEKLANVYRESDVFVLPTRAEGFAMPILEGMASSNYIITTNFGGQVDFVPKGNILLGGKMVPASKFTNELYYERANWLEPDFEKLKESLRWAFENRSKVKSIGNKNAKCALNWTWEKTAKSIIKRVEKLS